MNFLTLEVSHSSVFGGSMTIVGGQLDGQHFSSGSAIFVTGDTIRFQERAKRSRTPSLTFHRTDDDDGVSVCDNSVPTLPTGLWVLHRTILRSSPAVVCSYFNKRTQKIEERYHKIFYKPGCYCCGPRFSKKISGPYRNEGDLEKLAA